MKESLESYQHLTNNALMYLNKMGYAHRSLDRFQQEWIKIGEFMKINSIEIYTPKIGELYLKHCSGHLKYEQLDEYQLNQIRFVSVLSDFTLTGTITASKRRTKTEQLEGVIGKSMIDWILDYQKHHNIKPYTAGCYYRCLSKLMVFLHKNEIFDTKDITPNILVEFTNSLQEFNYGVIREIITKMNKYLFHLYETGITSRNLSAIIKKPKFVRNPKLPNYYTKEEIEQIVSKINRATPEGKRDYAIILLAARLGLRTSDISNLSFSNINWEKSTISICQTKTGQMVDLPLLPEVGNAIVEYLRFGRPVSESKSVFLRHTDPFEKMAINHLYYVCKCCITNSGVRCDGRKYGLHTFRHSLATSLLKEDIPMTTISNILGHNNLESTKLYLRVNIETLRKCALELPTFNRKEAIL